jgi:hypothetical protein
VCRSQYYFHHVPRIAVCIKKAGDTLACIGEPVEQFGVFRYRQMRPIARQRALMLSLVCRSVEHSKGDAEELADKNAPILIAAFARETEVLAQNTPGGLGQIGVTLHDEIRANRFARKDHGSPFVNMKVHQDRAEQRPRLRGFSGLRNRNQPFVAGKIVGELRSRLAQPFVLINAVYAPLIERKYEERLNAGGFVVTIFR